MAKQVTKRCHWVPQSYLKAFAAEGTGSRIWRFSKNDGEPELKRIDKVAVKYHLYSPLGPDGRRDDAMEKKLAELENFFGEPVWKSFCTDYPDLSWEPLRKMVALMAAVMWLRTPRQFEFWKNLHSQFADFFAQGETLPDAVYLNDRRVKLDTSSWPAYRDASEDDIKRSWNEWGGQSAGVATMFLKMRWAVLVSDEAVFITSDNPVMVGDTIGPHRGLNHWKRWSPSRSARPAC